MNVLSIWTLKTLGLARGINCFQKLKSRCSQVKNHYSKSVLKCFGMRFRGRKYRRWENHPECRLKGLLGTEVIECDLFLLLVPLLQGNLAKEAEGTGEHGKECVSVSERVWGENHTVLSVLCAFILLFLPTL